MIYWLEYLNVGWGVILISNVLLQDW